MTIRSVCEKLPLYYPGLQLDQWNKPVAWIFSCCDFILLNGLVSSFKKSFYSHGDNHGHLTWTIYIKFRSPCLRMPHMKLSFDWPSGFRGEDLSGM